MTALYCEIDPFAAAWLRGLIDAGHIAPGVVTETPLQDLYPHDLLQYDQVHLCAGIAVWSYALRRIGWPDDQRIWSSSFPCQPFSAAGKGLGFADERHLWPYGLHLIQQCRPDLIVGEQVASTDGLAWLDVVFADLEASGYAVWAVDLCAAGVGAPHIRQRTWWFAKRVEHPAGNGRDQRWPEPSGRGTASGCGVEWLGHDDDARLEGHRNGYQAEVGRDGTFRPIAAPGEFGGVGNSEREQPGRYTGTGAGAQGGSELWPIGNHTRPSGATLGLADPQGVFRPHQPKRAQPNHESGSVQQFGIHNGTDGGNGCGPDTSGSIASGAICGHTDGARHSVGGSGPVNGLWSDADWLFCRDNKWRPVMPGSFPLAHGLPRSMAALGPELSGLAVMAGLDGKSLARAKAHRVGTLKGYGNAIVASVAEEFLRAALLDGPVK